MSGIVLLGFLPWTDPDRKVSVRENPAALAAERAAWQLAARGLVTTFVPVAVSGDGITRALARARSWEPQLMVAVGQAPTGPRIERFGRVPGAWSPRREGEESPWLLAPDADALAARLNELRDPAAETEPFVASDDAGAYFCDHLCVELVREGRRRPVPMRFLHVTAIDACTPEIRAARLSLYVRQIIATVDWLRRQP